MRSHSNTSPSAGSKAANIASGSVCLSKMGKVDYCWLRNPDIPLVQNIHWKPEPANLPEEDPLFAAALRTEPSIFVEDVETADPKVVNREFERRDFGHRALIHAHLCFENQLWGVLQPCIFGNKRVWSQSDRAVINQVVTKIAPLAVAYVKAATVNN